MIHDPYKSLMFVGVQITQLVLKKNQECTQTNRWLEPFTGLLFFISSPRALKEGKNCLPGALSFLLISSHTREM